MVALFPSSSAPAPCVAILSSASISLTCSVYLLVGDHNEVYSHEERRIETSHNEDEGTFFYHYLALSALCREPRFCFWGHLG